MKAHFGRIFLTGLLTVLPVLATLYFTLWLLAGAERFFGKQVMLLMPDEYYRTGMGLLVAIAAVFGVGLLMHGVLFRRLSREDAMKFILTAGLKSAPGQDDVPARRRAAARAAAGTPPS